MLAKARLGTDVIAEARKAQEESQLAKTFGELIPAYVLVREKGGEFREKVRPKTLIEITRYLEKVWLPLHDKPVDQINLEVVEKLQKQIMSESGLVSANRACAVLSTFFAWAIKQGNANSNPTIGLGKMKEARRGRALSEDELTDVWICAADDDYGRIVKLLILTAQRRGEIGGLEWSEIDFEERRIDLPPQRVKNKQEHVIPLSEAALALLEDIPRHGRYVFGGNGFTSWEYGKQSLKL
jgi:integrase